MNTELLEWTDQRIEMSYVPPLLVVEVLSPGTKARDRGRKREGYAREGAGWYWIVNPVKNDITFLVNIKDRFETAQPSASDGPCNIAEPFPMTLDLPAIFRTG